MEAGRPNNVHHPMSLWTTKVMPEILVLALLVLAWILIAYGLKVNYFTMFTMEANQIINRPGVAGAVLQTPSSLINSFIHSFIHSFI